MNVKVKVPVWLAVVPLLLAVAEATDGDESAEKPIERKVMVLPEDEPLTATVSPELFSASKP